MSKIVLDPCVEDELWAIWKHIAVDNPEAANRVVEAAYQTFQELLSTPGLGRARKFRNSRLRGVRSWRVTNAGGLRAALTEALAANAPTLIEVMTDIAKEASPWEFIFPGRG